MGSSGNRGRSRGSTAVVLGLARAKGDGDSRIVRAGLHSICVVSGISVGRLLWDAGSSVGGDFPVTIPWVAVDFAQVVPDSAIVVESVLVLEDLTKIGAVGQLDRPSIAVGKLGPLLGVGAVSGENLVNLGVASISRWGVVEVHVVFALVDDDGTANGVGGCGGHKGGSCKDGALHCCYMLALMLNVDSFTEMGASQRMKT